MRIPLLIAPNNLFLCKFAVINAIWPYKLFFFQNSCKIFPINVCIFNFHRRTHILMEDEISFFECFFLLSASFMLFFSPFPVPNNIIFAYHNSPLNTFLEFLIFILFILHFIHSCMIAIWATCWMKLSCGWLRIFSVKLNLI